eukprot:406055_1
MSQLCKDRYNNIKQSKHYQHYVEYVQHLKSKKKSQIFNQNHLAKIINLLNKLPDISCKLYTNRGHGSHTILYINAIPMTLSKQMLNIHFISSLEDIMHRLTDENVSDEMENDVDRNIERMLQQIQETDQKMEEKQSGTKQAETKKIRRIWWQAMNKTFQDNIKVEEDQKERHADNEGKLKCFLKASLMILKDTINTLGRPTDGYVDDDDECWDDDEGSVSDIIKLNYRCSSLTTRFFFKF